MLGGWCVIVLDSIVHTYDTDTLLCADTSTAELSYSAHHITHQPLHCACTSNIDCFVSLCVSVGVFNCVTLSNES